MSLLSRHIFLSCDHISCTLQDLPGALSDAQVAEGLGLHNIKSR